MASQGLPAKGLADGDAVGAIARGLVREYLLRKGMTQALATFDKEAPPSSSVGTTGDLIKSLRLGSLRQRSTAQERPVDTVLELLTQYFYASELSSSAPPAGSFWARLQAKKAASAAAGSSTGSDGAQGADAPASAAAAAAPAQAFVAPDGRTFSDQTAFRRYVFEGWYTFVGKSGEMLRKLPGEVSGQPFNLRDLTDCTVEILDHCDAMHVEALRRCTVFIAASSESVFMRDCHDCDVWLACKQLRTRDCSNCRLFLYSKTDPIIETSTGMGFAPFTGASPKLDEMFASAHLAPERNLWNRVFDFNKGETCVPEPHWSVLPTEQIKSRSIVVDGLPAPVNPVEASPQATTGSAVAPSRGASSGGMVAFDIRSTSQSDAERALAVAAKRRT
ncbi:hypothetical protein FNF31_06412 [Cafeteria roenbergensis]|uniref:C-CAP/cofactor C-like domain-containing protein n=1 Tax=Cafeteria roenbergensis TaxID=33653 RepID=A0A5A8CLX9_CAFRO|nr:hypothetical protein FNF31_06412 [Cafeteria roenbergensis]